MKKFYTRSGEKVNPIRTLELLGGIDNEDRDCPISSTSLFTIDENTHKIVEYNEITNEGLDLLKNGVAIVPDFKLCVYIKGVTHRGGEVIELLTRLGGKDGDLLMGDDEDNFYYIDCDGYICKAENVGDCMDLREMLKMHALQLQLPRVVTINGHQYDEDKVAERLTGLKPIK